MNIEPFSLIILFVSSNLTTGQVYLQLFTNVSFTETKRKPMLSVLTRFSFALHRNLHSNKFSGAIPADLGHLQYLEEL